MEDLKVGDRVKIVDDSPLARRILKESNAGEGPYKWSLFGKIGTISQSWIVNGNYAVTVGDENEYCWPPVLLEKLPAEEVRFACSSEAFNAAMLAACGKIRYDFDSVEATVNFMRPMEAVAMVECPPAKCQCAVQIGSDPSPLTPGVAEIVFDHVVNDGKCMLQIADIRGVSRCDDLLDEYCAGRPVMDSPSPGVLWTRFEDDEIRRYFVGQLLTEEEAAKLVKRMRACGKRLHDINVAARAKADEERMKRWQAKGRKTVRI